jgi:hypothetical protein
MDLLNGMSMPAQELASLSAVLFRRKLIEEGVYEHLSPDVKNAAAQVATLITPERPALLLKNLADCSLHLAIANGQEAELLNQISNWINAQEPNLRQTAIYVFELATEFPTFNA